jgi:hypothetical protein
MLGKYQIHKVSSLFVVWFLIKNLALILNEMRHFEN